MLRAIFLPQQEQRHAAPFQLPVHYRPVGQRPRRLLLECRRREQPALELAVVHPFRHRPGDADHGSPPQILANRRSADAEGDGDLPLAHAKGMPQSQNFSNLPHRRSLGGHQTSPCLAAKVGWSAIRSPSSRASGRFQQGGRLRSEWVADFRRNRWPDCVGISGRLASDYACHRDSRRVPVAKSPGKCARSIMCRNTTGAGILASYYRPKILLLSRCVLPMLLARLVGTRRFERFTS